MERCRPVQHRRERRARHGDGRPMTTRPCSKGRRHRYRGVEAHVTAGRPLHRAQPRIPPTDLTPSNPPPFRLMPQQCVRAPPDPHCTAARPPPLHPLSPKFSGSYQKFAAGDGWLVTAFYLFFPPLGYDGRKPSALNSGFCKGLHSRDGSPLTRIQLGERRGYAPSNQRRIFFHFFFRERCRTGRGPRANKYGTQESPG